MIPGRHRFRVRVCHLSSGERLPLVVGFPVSKPNQWALTVRRPRVQANTLIEDLRTVAHLYDWADRRAVSLQDRFRTGNGLQPGELSDLYQNLRYVRPMGRLLANRRLHDATELRTVSSSTHAARVTIARDYLVWALEQTLYRLPVDDLRQRPVPPCRARQSSLPLPVNTIAD